VRISLQKLSLSSQDRLEKGLPSLPDPDKKVENETKGDTKSDMNSSKKKQKEAAVTLSFSSSGAKAQHSNKLKRKVVGDLNDSDEGTKKALKKKSKKTRKGPLSFGEDV
jgi:ribosomal protein S7